MLYIDKWLKKSTTTKAEVLWQLKVESGREKKLVVVKQDLLYLTIVATKLILCRDTFSILEF